MAALVTVQGLGWKFGQLPVLDGVSLEVHPGQNVAVVGPSGCGKTTLLRLIAGLLHSHGHHGNGSFSVNTARIAFVFQEDRLIPWKNVAQNLRFVAPTADEATLHETLGLMDMSESRKAYPAQLSGGMRQRVNVARALVSNPELILMDEPFQSLDETIKANILSRLSKLQAQRGFSTLLVTHSLREALCFAHRIYFLTPRPATNRFVQDVTIPPAHRHLFDPVLLQEEGKILQRWFLPDSHKE
ncbi:MAG TPA: ABC transporter ATP-binding protein [Thermotogota bacterium]|nr:ABC transporter ATP-binding protein [Thermotogota bacterium]HRW92936.1 ABC transporter ATP-binding protein [Thermotogota bacterium]